MVVRPLMSPRRPYLVRTYRRAVGNYFSGRCRVTILLDVYTVVLVSRVIWAAKLTLSERRVNGNGAAIFNSLDYRWLSTAKYLQCIMLMSKCIFCYNLEIGILFRLLAHGPWWNFDNAPLNKQLWWLFIIVAK